jgi:hypothetical protein
MFLPIEVQSVNSPDQLKAGEYAVRCGVYASPDQKMTVLHYEYTRTGVADADASDVLLIDEAGAVRMCDFIRMPDRSWRDSFGARSDSILALLPSEIADFRLVEERSLPSQILGETHDR